MEPLFHYRNMHEVISSQNRHVEHIAQSGISSQDFHSDIEGRNSAEPRALPMLMKPVLPQTSLTPYNVWPNVPKT